VRERHDRIIRRAEAWHQSRRGKGRRGPLSRQDRALVARLKGWRERSQIACSDQAVGCARDQGFSARNAALTGIHPATDSLVFFSVDAAVLSASSMIVRLSDLVAQCFGFRLNLIGAGPHVSNLTVHGLYALQRSANALNLLQNRRGVHRYRALASMGGAQARAASSASPYS
jgi:hypothetical protein